MRIQTNLAHYQNLGMQSLQANLNELLHLTLPPDVKQKIKDFKLQMQSYKIPNDTSSYQTLGGEVLSSEQILKIINKASGTTRWVLSENQEVKSEQLEKIKTQFAVQVKEGKYYKYRF